MAKIELTPSELIAQSVEMGSLKGEYESLFSSTSSILTSMNYNWSTNLARNFAGKIDTANASFTTLIETLQTGAELANKSASSFESIDSLLAKTINGNQAILDNGLSFDENTYQNLFDEMMDNGDGLISSFLNSLFGSNELVQFLRKLGIDDGLEGLYSIIPKSLITAMLKLDDHSDIAAVYSLISDMITGDLKAKDFSSIVGLIFPEYKLIANTIGNTLDILFSSDVSELINYDVDTISSAYSQGGIITGTFDLLASSIVEAGYIVTDAVVESMMSNAVVSGISAIIETTTGVNLTKEVRNFTMYFLNEYDESLRELSDWIAPAEGEMWSWIGNTASDLWDTAVDSAGDIWDTATSILENTGDLIVSGVDSVWDGITSIFAF